MGFLCFFRGAFTHSGCYAAQVRKYAALCKCATSLTPSGIRVKRYCQDTADRKDVSGLFVCYHLPHRTIVKIQGQETSTFLQGLITNDMGLLVDEPVQSAMYSHMLSVQGRTLYDIMLYRYYACISLVMCFCFGLFRPRGRGHLSLLSCSAVAALPRVLVSQTRERPSSSICAVV